MKCNGDLHLESKICIDEQRSDNNKRNTEKITRNVSLSQEFIIN